VVDFNTGTCDCNYRQVTSISSKHAVKCLSYVKADLKELVHESYTIEKYNAIYDGTMYYARDACLWLPLENIPLLAPPPIDRKRGPI